MCLPIFLSRLKIHNYLYDPTFINYSQENWNHLPNTLFKLLPRNRIPVIISLRSYSHEWIFTTSNNHPIGKEHVTIVYSNNNFIGHIVAKKIYSWEHVHERIKRTIINTWTLTNKLGSSNLIPSTSKCNHYVPECIELTQQLVPNSHLE